jgi:teichuronic acid biosynthesis glycosyltransferase TuaG
MTRLVSILMPAYNADKYIAESIQSVMAQTLADWELIVVDDGSTDNTAEVVNAFVSADTRIKYFYQPNGRLGKARNTAFRYSTAGLIAFLDSDDLWLPEKLELQVAALNEQGADVVYTDGFIFSGDDVADESTTFPIVFGRHDGADMFDWLLVRNRIAVLSVMLRREALGRAGPFEERPSFHGSEDYDLWLRLAKQGAVFYGMGERLVRYRRHAGAMTNAESNVLRPMLTVVEKHMGDSRLSEAELKKRVTGLYRDLISALLEEDNLVEAKRQMEQFAAWDKGRLITKCQRLLLKLSPRNYNVISRACLYRAEWHFNRLADKLKHASSE